jgi:hypothetical protein
MRSDVIDAPKLPSILSRIHDECKRHDERCGASAELWPLFRLQMLLLQLFAGLFAAIGLIAVIASSQRPQTAAPQWLADWIPDWTLLALVAAIAAPGWLAQILDDRASTVLRAYEIVPAADGTEVRAYNGWRRFRLVLLWLGQRITVSSMRAFTW